MSGEEINAIVKREPHRVMVSIAETDRAKAGIAGLTCELLVGSVPPKAPPLSPVPPVEPESEPLEDLKLRLGDLRKERERTRELREATCAYVHELKLERVHQGNAWPTARRLELREFEEELRKYEEELKELDRKIHDLDAKIECQSLISLSTRDGLPYATA
jgi:DNA repair exonuclease SbcCD ATPase subunit